MPTFAYAARTRSPSRSPIVETAGNAGSAARSSARAQITVSFQFLLLLRRMFPSCIHCDVRLPGRPRPELRVDGADEILQAVAFLQLHSVDEERRRAAQTDLRGLAHVPSHRFGAALGL